jgi:glycosyltransferase involved in cell wall biosynthesis
LKIALYYPWIYLTSGAERIIVELASRSRHEWALFTNHYEPQHTFPEIRRWNVVELNRVPVKRDIVSTATAALRIMRQKLPMEDYDALFVLSEGLGDLILFRNGQRPSLCYCLTPLRAAFDPVYRMRSYEKRGTLGKVALAAGLSIFRMVDKRAWKRYSRMLFLSREVVGRARRGGLIGEESPEVLNIGVGLKTDRASEIFERFFLLPGRIMWTKNLELGIRAFQRFQSLCPEFADFRLVLAGLVDEKSRSYLADLKKLSGGNPQIEFRLAPSDEDLRNLYATCYGVLFTAFNEDFGLVPIESMAFGKPVIAVARGGPIESIENGVQGFLVEPDPEPFARCMGSLAADPETARLMGAAGPRRAAQFSWDRFVSRIDEVLDELAGTRAMYGGV